MSAMLQIRPGYLNSSAKHVYTLHSRRDPVLATHNGPFCRYLIDARLAELRGEDLRLAESMARGLSWTA